METGDRFPDFELPDENGDIFRSSELEGVRYVIYFYPRDGTAGCTREATDFTALLPKFMMRNVPVIGVRRDSSGSHRRGVAKNGLRIKLLSDSDRVLTEKVGAWGVKRMYGKEAEGTVRTTFLVGRDGVIEAVWKNVRVDGHAEKVLEKVVSLVRH
jgi:peroxiredoxin Q/BCP